MCFRGMEFFVSVTALLRATDTSTCPMIDVHATGSGEVTLHYHFLAAPPISPLLVKQHSTVVQPISTYTWSSILPSYPAAGAFGGANYTSHSHTFQHPLLASQNQSRLSLWRPRQENITRRRIITAKACKGYDTILRQVPYSEAQDAWDSLSISKGSWVYLHQCEHLPSSMSSGQLIIYGIGHSIAVLASLSTITPLLLRYRVHLYPFDSHLYSAASTPTLRASSSTSSLVRISHTFSTIHSYRAPSRRRGSASTSSPVRISRPLSLFARSVIVHHGRSSAIAPFAHVFSAFLGQRRPSASSSTTSVLSLRFPASGIQWIVLGPWWAVGSLSHSRTCFVDAFRGHQHALLLYRLLNGPVEQRILCSGTLAVVIVLYRIASTFSLLNVRGLVQRRPAP